VKMESNLSGFLLIVYFQHDFLILSKPGYFCCGSIEEIFDNKYQEFPLHFLPSDGIQYGVRQHGIRPSLQPTSQLNSL